jgi:hypothetical protein
MLPLALAVLIQLNPGDPPGIEPGMISFPWHVIEGSVGGFGSRHQTSVRFYRVAQGREPTATQPYWMVRLTQDVNGVPGQSSHTDRWIDGRACAAVNAALAALPRQTAEPYRPDEITTWGPFVQPHDIRFTYTTYGRMDGEEVAMTYVDRWGGAVAKSLEEIRARLLTCPEGATP